MYKMLVITFAISLVLMSTATAARLPEDSIEHSGDFNAEINPFNAEMPDLNEKSNEDDVTEAFSNQQQRHRKQQQQQQNQKLATVISSTERSQIKPKSRKADLNDDVNEFVDLVPKSEVKAKIEEYYRNDMDVQHIFEYMHGKEFLELRKHILELADVKDTIQYLNKHGLNIKSVLRKLDHRLGISKIRSTQMAYNPQSQFGKRFSHKFHTQCAQSK